MKERSAGYLLLVLTIVLNASGQLLLKRATMARAGGGFMLDVLLSPWFIAGGVAQVATMISWLLVLRRLPLTVAHPMTGAVFVAVPLASHLFWGEPLGPQRVIGILVIVLGIAVVAGAAS